MELRNSLSPLWAATREDLRSRRAAHSSRKALERELASYATHAEQNELAAILDRADPAASAEIRSIMDGIRVA